MYYRNEFWVNQYQALIQLHLDNGGHMGSTHHVFSDGLNISWERIDDGGINDLMLYHIVDDNLHNSLCFKVECLEKGYLIKLVIARANWIHLNIETTGHELGIMMESLLWRTIKAFETFWYD